MPTTSDQTFWSLEVDQVDPGEVRAGLGARVRKVRLERLGMTLAEFGRRVAELSGRKSTFSNVTVANWESGRQEPSFASLQAIARLAHLPLCYFAGAGDLQQYPRIDWLAPIEHTNDVRLRDLIEDLGGLPASHRQAAVYAIEGLLEGLHRATVDGGASDRGR